MKNIREAEYVNISPSTIKVVGTDGKMDTIPAGAKVIRPDWYNRYVPKYLKLIKYVGKKNPIQTPIVKKPNSTFKMNKSNSTIKNIKPRPANASVKRESRKIVGKKISNPVAAYQAAKTTNPIHISNNIGVGVLSYNRIDCLKRLINSIRSYTDLSKTTIFISDESDSISQEDINWLNSLQNIVVIRNSRIGIAGNSNRLLNCLSRFKYKILLNDDVEILNNGWEHFYVDAALKSGIKHFCYRQVGVYGAQIGSRVKINNFDLNVIHEKPHGAVMFFDDDIFKEIGFFDESFGLYGMEHVDWSERAASAQKQSGFFDVPNSDHFFKIHSEATSATNKAEHLNKAKQLYSKIKGTRRYVHASSNSNVDGISVIVPFQGNDRLDDIATVVNNIRAMKCPNVEIVLVEQDSNKKINEQILNPINYKFTTRGKLFNKSAAFNYGVKISKFNNVVLHDGDIVTKPIYLSEIMKILQHHDGCHLGAKVHYLNQDGTNNFNRSGQLPDGNLMNVVGYFEGGSIACKKSTYYKIGGFDEAYEGYGCEDCCFFERLKGLSNFYDTRSYDFFHLYHSRSSDMESCHAKNKTYYREIKKQSLNDRANYLSKKLGI